MFQYKELESEKYYAAHIEKQYKEARLYKGRQAMKEMMAVVAGLCTIGIILFSATQIDNWAVIVSDFIQTWMPALMG